jgi:SAM-dependent methyltransferase
MDDPRDANRRLWNAWTDLHVESEYYDVDGFLAGRDPLDPIVLRAVGDVADRRLLHLQCHFGLDTLAFARRGAEVTGVDFAERSVTEARRLAERAGLRASFVLSPVEDLIDRLDGEFDIVFSSWGVLPWIGDLDRWTAVATHFLGEGGVLVLVEAHPFTWIFDDERTDDRLVPAWSYFTDEPCLFPLRGSYAVPDAAFEADSYQWMHTVSRILGAVSGAGLDIEAFHEYPEVVYPALSFLVEGEDGLWRVPAGRPELPLTFSLRAVRRSR